MRLMLTLLALTLTLLGCGDGSSTRAPEEPTMANVNGSVTKGPVAGATVLIYTMDESGEATGEAIAGPITTEDNGSWTADIPNSAPRPLLVEAIGGTYTDEATGGLIEVGDRKLSSFLPSGTDSSSVSPASNVVVRAARQFLANNNGATLEESIETGIQTLRNALGASFDPLTVTPDPTSTELEPRQYAALLGGLSTLANNQSPGTDPLDTVIALIEDASDGEIDGRNDGSDITIGESADTLPILSSTDVTQAVADFTSDSENGDFSGITSFTASSTSTGNGRVSPALVPVFEGSTVEFTLAPEQGASIGDISGCAGTRNGNVFETAPLVSTCQLNVTFNAINYVVSVADVNGGSANRSSATALFGETVSFTLSPNRGYRLASASGCGGSLSGNTYTTGAITGNCEITPVFRLERRNIIFTALPEEGGTFDLESPFEVGFGSNLQVTITPEEGFELDSVTFGETAGCEGVLTDSVYSIDSVTEDCELTANFIPLFTITGTVTGPGTISPPEETANEGDVVSFTLTANDGAALAEVLAPECPGTLTDNTYTTGPISSDCIVSAEFRNLYTITAVAGDGGSVSPESTEALEGEAKAFELTPDTGFEIDSVTGCGGSLDSTTYITGAITADCEINATFAESELPDAVWDNFNWDEANWQ